MSRAALETLTAHVPYRLVKRGGRKEIVMPEGATVQRLRIDNAVVKALARAFRWKRMIDSGAFATIGDLADHEKIAASYMTRVMRLTLLAPEIVEDLLAGRDECRMCLAALMEPFAMEWVGQLRLGNL